VINSLFQQGLTHYRAGNYFDAHEAWEDAWHAATDSRDRALFKGLVQLAVCLEHARRGNPRGCVRMAERCERNFRGLGTHHNIDTEFLVSQLQQWVASVRAMDVDAMPPGKVRGMDLPVAWDDVPPVTW